MHNVRDARRLRRELTPTERLLWHHLRGRRFSGHKFRRQHPVGAFVLDFYCAAYQLAVEINGAVHASDEARAKDKSRQVILEERGIRFIRIPAWVVERDLETALRTIEQSLEAPHPSPLPFHGRGGSSDDAV